MADEYLTTGEFTRWRSEEVEFRRDVRKSLDDVVLLLRVQNGRIGKSELTLEGVRERLAQIEAKDGSIATAVTDIQEHGCHQIKEHGQVIQALNGAGALPDTDGPPRPAFRFPDLNPKQKAVAGVGIGALLIPAVSDLAKLATALVGWLHRAAGSLP